MNVLMELPGIYEDALARYRARMEWDSFLTSGSSAETVFRYSGSAGKTAASGRTGEDREEENVLIYGDNLDVLTQGLRSGLLKERIDMIYCDPPFFTRSARAARLKVKSGRFPEIRELRMPAFNDGRRIEFREYLTEMTLRLMFMRETLSDTGSILIHLDSRAVHSVKLLMDAVFGEDCFVNEIIWTYKSGGASGRHLARKHDNILFYSKSKNYKFNVLKEKSYNRGLKPYRFRGVEEFRDEVGWYTMVRQKDVWQVDMVGRSSGERLQYATQKPEALLDGIIAMTTEEGDLCADFYCGSGTLAASAARMGRRFLCVDQTRLAVSNAMRRPLSRGTAFVLRDFSNTAQDAENGSSPSAVGSREGTDAADDSIVNDFLSGALRAVRGADGVRLQAAAEPAPRPRDVRAPAPDAARVPAGAAPSSPVPETAGTQDSLALLRQEDPEALTAFWCFGSLDEKGVFHASGIAGSPSGKTGAGTEAGPRDTHVWIGDICGGMTIVEIENEV